jgi:hypothetical protein
MNFNPGRHAFIAEGPPAVSPRTALVCDIAEQIYGAGWRYSIATEFAIGPDEIEDWIEQRAVVPDVLIAGLLRRVRVRAAGHAALANALAEDTARAPEGDYSFPGALARNGRVMIRECESASLLYDEQMDEYYFADAINTDRVPVTETAPSIQLEHDASHYGAAMMAGGPMIRAAELELSSNVGSVVGSAPNNYREPRVDVRDRI